jgi:class 3 adenylate cyclase
VRFVAVVSADVAGYSRLMGQDDSDTLTRLKTHRRELIDPKIAEYDGRIVKTTGDGLLLAFPSVVRRFCIWPSCRRTKSQMSHAGGRRAPRPAYASIANDAAGLA